MNRQSQEIHQHAQRPKPARDLGIFSAVRHRCDVLFAMLKNKELYRAPAIAAPAAA